jgi:hypothetical protein
VGSGESIIPTAPRRGPANSPAPPPGDWRHHYDNKVHPVACGIGAAAVGVVVARACAAAAAIANVELVTTPARSTFGDPAAGVHARPQPPSRLVGFTVGFLIVAAGDEGTSVLELGGVEVAMLLFYAPATVWTTGRAAVGAILATGFGAAALTHCYRAAGTKAALQRTGRVVFVLLLSYGWVFVVGGDVPVLRLLRRCGGSAFLCAAAELE